MKIVHICESDGGGGAMLAAAKLHRALADLGMDSSMIVARKLTDDTRIVDLQDEMTIGDRIRTKLRRHVNHRTLRKYRSRAGNSLGLLTTGVGKMGSALAKHLPDADVYAVHWSHELIDYLPLFEKIHRKPAFWRMADMNPMTGGCHYAMECEGFLRTCGDCPLLERPGKSDLSYQSWQRKDQAIRMLDTKLFRPVAPSRWLKAEAERSSLLGRFDTIHIPTGVNTDLYRPIPKDRARNHFNLPDDARIVLFASDRIDDHRKGFDLLLAALKTLPSGQKILPVAIGIATEKLSGITYLGKLNGPDELSMAYSAADVFVLPTRADNLPNVALEAMSCGIPIVSFDVGGMPDCVAQGETGFLVDCEDQEALARHILEILENADLMQSMSLNSRQRAKSVFSEERSAKLYARLCKNLVSGQASERP